MKDMVGMRRVQCRSDVGPAARPDHREQPGTEFFRTFQMLEHFLTDKEVALLLIAVANIALLDRIAACVIEKFRQDAR